jgi:hypothetical protein
MPNLTSASSTHVADIRFLPPQTHDFPIIIFNCWDILTTSHTIRTWLQYHLGPHPDLSLRLDDQALDRVWPEQLGQLVLLEGAATLEGKADQPISVFAIFVPKDERVRWFWTLKSPTSLLEELDYEELIGKPACVPTSSPRHGGLYTFLTTAFHAATTFPHAPDYLAAVKLLDLCPSIQDPATACSRIEADTNLFFNGEGGADLSDDRYLLHVEPAERELISVVDMGCAEYLLHKRLYFKQLAREVICDSEKIRRATFNRLQQRQMAQWQSTQRPDTPVAEGASPTPSVAGSGSAGGAEASL